MIQLFFENDFKREYRRRREKEQEQAAQKVAEASAGVEISSVRFQNMDTLLADVAEKMVAIRQATPPDPYPTVFEGNPLKVFIKRCVRKLTWWFVWKRTVQTHWHHEMICASIQSLDACCREMKACVQELLAQEQAMRNHAMDEQNRRFDEAMRTERAASANAVATAIANERVRTKSEIDKAIAEERLVNLQKTEEQAAAARKEAEKSNITNYIDYTDFENQFRGSQDEICSRIRRYLPQFCAGQTVLDLGCGRGEWLELLKEHGVNAIGIDLNPKNIEMCQVKQLHAEQADLFEYLESLPDASVDGITSIQVIEHLTPAQLANMVQLCRKKLRTGGRLILETQNPASVFAMANYFYVDPTHIRPVHPNWLKYLLQSNHFIDVMVDYPDYSVTWDHMLPYFTYTENEVGAKHSVDAVNHLLYAASDYAIVATKG